MEENANAQLATPRSAGIRWGLISGVFSIAYFLVLSVMGVNMGGPIQYLGWLIAAVFVFLSHKYYKDNGDGFMSYGQGIGIAALMALVSSVISSIFMYIYIKFIDGSFMEMIKNNQLEEMQKKGMSEEQIDQAMKMASMFMTPEWILVFGFIGGIFVTVVCALIVTIFTQKKRADQFV